VNRLALTTSAGCSDFCMLESVARCRASLVRRRNHRPLLQPEVIWWKAPALGDESRSDP
jgi:hypothetical protein